MNAPLIAQDYQSAIQPITTPVRTDRDLDLGIVVRGVVTDSQILSHIAGSEHPIWALDVALDGGLSGRFGCSQADLELLGYEDAGSLKGSVFTAIVTKGPGPARGGLDLEPSSIYYLSEFATLQGPRGIVAANNGYSHFDKAS